MPGRRKRWTPPSVPSTNGIWPWHESAEPSRPPERPSARDTPRPEIAAARKAPPSGLRPPSPGLRAVLDPASQGKGLVSLPLRSGGSCREATEGATGGEGGDPRDRSPATHGWVTGD